MTITQDLLFQIQDEFNQRILEDNLIIAYELYSNNKPLLYFSHPSLSKDKNNWIFRKRNVVDTFGQSSKEIAEKNKHDIESFSLKYGYSHEDYALVSGSVPIINNNKVVVGILTVTGLQPEEDHQLACDILELVLNNTGGI